LSFLLDVFFIFDKVVVTVSSLSHSLDQIRRNAVADANSEESHEPLCLVDLSNDFIGVPHITVGQQVDEPLITGFDWLFDDVLNWLENLCAAHIIFKSLDLRDGFGNLIVRLRFAEHVFEVASKAYHVKVSMFWEQLQK